MKNQVIKHSLFLVIISVFFGTTTLAQSTKKNTVRLRVQYVKIMDTEVYFDIKATSRIDKKNVNVADIDLNVYNEVDDESILIGKVTTGMDGVSRFTIEDINSIQHDTTNVYNVKVAFKGNDDDHFL